MIVMKGVCSVCNDGKEKYLKKRKPPLCGFHYSVEQSKKQREKQRLKPKKLKDATGELVLFQKLWNQRRRVSFVSGEPIEYFSVSNFAHVLPKAKNRYPEFKLKEENIVLLTFEEHFLWDNGSRSDLRLKPEWKELFELEEKLKIEYNERN